MECLCVNVKFLECLACAFMYTLESFRFLSFDTLSDLGPYKSILHFNGLAFKNLSFRYGS